MLIDNLGRPGRYPDIDLGLIHTGGTTFLVTVVTMTGEQGVKAVEITKPRTAIPIHYNDSRFSYRGSTIWKEQPSVDHRHQVRLPCARRNLQLPAST